MRYYSHITPPQSHSNIPCSCGNVRCAHCARTVGTPQSHQTHLDTTLPDILPVQSRRPRPTMLVDDYTTVQHSTDTETLEHIVEYLDAVGNVVMTQVVDPRTWALHHAPFARRRAK